MRLNETYYAKTPTQRKPPQVLPRENPACDQCCRIESGLQLRCLISTPSHRVDASKPARLRRSRLQRRYRAKTYPQTPFCHAPRFPPHPATLYGLRSILPAAPPVLFPLRGPNEEQNRPVTAEQEKINVRQHKPNPKLYAQQHIRHMRGGSQCHLMHASDGGYWIVKFRNNPQHPRVLANEFLASRIGRCLGLPIPEVQVIEVSDWVIQKRRNCASSWPVT